MPLLDELLAHHAVVAVVPEVDVDPFARQPIALQLLHLPGHVALLTTDINHLGVQFLAGVGVEDGDELVVVPGSGLFQ